jgi:hypothetical protein
LPAATFGLAGALALRARAALSDIATDDDFFPKRPVDLALTGESEKSKSSFSSALFTTFGFVAFLLDAAVAEPEREEVVVELVTFTMTLLGTDTGVAFVFFELLVPFEALGVDFSFLSELSASSRGFFLPSPASVAGVGNSSKTSITFDLRFLTEDFDIFACTDGRFFAPLTTTAGESDWEMGDTSPKLLSKPSPWPGVDADGENEGECS